MVNESTLKYATLGHLTGFANNLFIETMKSYQDTFDNKYATNQFVCQ